MIRILRWVLLLGLVLLAVLAIGAWRLQPTSHAKLAYEPPAVDLEAASRRLAEAVRIETISAREDTPEQLAPFLALHELLARSYPLAHQHMQREVVGGAGLLYRWPGKDPTCAPVLYAAHQDVVPVEPGSEDQWRHPPYSGDIAEDAIWGRGTIDDKGSLMALMEAAESLLASGFQPPCDVYYAFGHDEEVGGRLGARRIAALLVERGVRLDYAVDEGGAITTGAFPGLALPLATIGVAEKGYMSLTLEVKVEGGHSSMPPRQTAIGMLAAAIARLEADPFPPSLGDTQRVLLREAGSHLSFGERMVFGNLWLTAPLVERALASKPATDATLRTTTAATMLNAGVKDNVLPSEARAVVNFRIRPGETSAGVRARVVAVIDDPRVQVGNDQQWTSEPTAPAPIDDPAYRRIAAALVSVHPEGELVVAPYVVSGGTDLRNYEALTAKLYRIVALELPVAELSRVHGSNERVERAEYARMIRFYQAMLAAPGVG